MPYKTCDKCGRQTGVRTKVCECGTEFLIKSRKNKPQKVEWTTLIKGDVIKSLQGCGGYHGIFEVSKLDENGIHCYSKHGGHFYLNMVPRQGPTGPMTVHKIEKLVNKR